MAVGPRSTHACTGRGKRELGAAAATGPTPRSLPASPNSCSCCHSPAHPASQPLSQSASQPASQPVGQPPPPPPAPPPPPPHTYTPPHPAPHTPAYTPPHCTPLPYPPPTPHTHTGDAHAEAFCLLEQRRNLLRWHGGRHPAQQGETWAGCSGTMVGRQAGGSRRGLKWQSCRSS